MTTRTTKTKEVPLVVTTELRGVFFGYGTPTDKTEIRLTKAQMCIYWSSDIGGVLGLAGKGPSKNCRVSKPIPAINLQRVTSIMECDKEAVKAWEKSPWA